MTIHLAERLQQMPIAKALFTDGLLAESALRLLADVWRADLAEVFARDEQMLVNWAVTLCHRDLKVVLERWQICVDPTFVDGTAPDRFDRRSLHLSEMLDGMGRLDGVLTREGLALVQEAIRNLSRTTGPDDTRRPEQRRADALVTMAKIAINSSGSGSAGSDLAVGRRNQPTSIATIAWDDLVDGSGAGLVDTGTGTFVVPTSTIQRLCCDAGIHRLVAAADGTTLDFGRRTRTVSNNLWTRLVARDHGCRIGDCPVGPAGCDAHHALHWGHDGETNEDNLVLACWWHHHWLHEQHWSIEPLGGGHFILRDPHGNEQRLRPPMTSHALTQLALPA